MNNEEMESEIEKVQKMYTRLSAELILSGISPLMVAGVLCANGVRMYKENMERSEYRKMINIICEQAVKET